METENLGLVKAIFRQSTQPVRTDILWYDTQSNELKVYNYTAQVWQPLHPSLIIAPVTESAPTEEEIETAVGLTAAQAGAGYHTLIQDSDENELVYWVESDGEYWNYITMERAV